MSAPPRIRAGEIALVAVLGLALFLPGIGSRDLWNPDEPRYAEVTREMIASGDYLVPHFNGRVYMQKPPLFFWSIALAARARGELDEVAVRLPSVLAGVLALVMVHLLASRFFSRRAAWLSTLAYGTCAKVLWQSRHGQIDMLLAAWVAMAVYVWVVGEQEDRPWMRLGFYVVAALATLTKGPAGLLPPLLSIALFLAVTGRTHKLRRLRLGWGLLIWAGLVALWLVPAITAAGPSYFQEVVLNQNLGRFFSPESDPKMAGHLKPWYYLATVVPGDFFPWALLLPGALWIGRRSGGRERDGYLLAVCWMAVTLVFFSLSGAKRSVYILSMYPAMALLVGSFVGRVAATRRSRGWLTWPLWGLAAIGWAVVAYGLAAGLGRPEVAQLGAGAREMATVLIFVAAVGFSVAAILAQRGRETVAAATLASTMAVLVSLASWTLVSRIDELKSVRPVAERLVAELDESESYGIYPWADGQVLFYSGRLGQELPSPESLQAFVASGGRWITARRDRLRNLTIEGGELVEVAGTDRDDRGIVLLRFEPTPSGDREAPGR